MNGSPQIHSSIDQRKVHLRPSTPSPLPHSHMLISEAFIVYLKSAEGRENPAIRAADFSCMTSGDRHPFRYRTKASLNFH